VDANILNKQRRTLTLLHLGRWTGNNYSPRRTGASDQMVHRGLGFGQIHWNINYPIPNILMTTDVCRQSGGDCLPQILGSSTSCQVEQQWLPNITTYFSLAYARTASKERARFSAKDRLILPGRTQFPRIRTIRHGLGNVSVSFWHSRFSFQQF